MEPPWLTPPELNDAPTAPPDVESLPPELARVPPESVKRLPEFELPQATPNARENTQSERQRTLAARDEPIIPLSIRRAPQTSKRETPTRATTREGCREFVTISRARARVGKCAERYAAKFRHLLRGAMQPSCRQAASEMASGAKPRSPAAQFHHSKE